MSTTTIADRTVDVNDEGFFTDPHQWTQAMPAELAHGAGIELTKRHWKIIWCMRQQWFEKGTAPTVRLLAQASGVPVKELYQLFPDGPAKTAAKIAGIPKPRGCV